MTTPYEVFVNRELPRRPVLLTPELTGWDDDPNSGSAPSIVANAPKGTFYLPTSETLYQKLSAAPGTYRVVAIAGSAIVRKTNVDLIGDKDGVNQTFFAPDIFILGSEAIFWNGLRQYRGIGMDYVLDESGGPGTGYDTVILAAAPVLGESLVADYDVES